MKKKTELANATPREVAPPDMIQTTILIDRSGSMAGIWQAAMTALTNLRKEVDCALLSVQVFNEEWKILKDFDGEEEIGDNLRPIGGTYLYQSLLQSIDHSRVAASLTPEFKAHHVFVVITDGQDTSNGGRLDEVKAEIAKMDVDATFFLLDSSGGQQAGVQLGWTSTSFENTPQSIKDAIGKVQKTINQVANNVAKKISPRSGLCLPPARNPKDLN